MPLLYERETLNPDDLYLRDPAAEMVSWQGRTALRLSGQGASLALLPELRLSQGKIEVELGADGAAYPGIVFRARDTHNYELAYIQPHTSGQWDAIQYDPVFHGSNTWQLYYGTGAQQAAQVPPHTWHRLSIEFQAQRAVIWVGDQSPLPVSRLAHDAQSGLAGLWTYLPAYYSHLRIWDDRPDWSSIAFPPLPEELVAGMLSEWFLEGFGRVTCEPGGMLNLNRYLPISIGQVRLIREIEMLESGSLAFDFGFSDELTLQVDDQDLFSGQNLFHVSPHWPERGYVSLANQVCCTLSRGRHRIVAALKVTEPFGYGMVMRITGDAYQLLPASLCE